MFGRYRISPPRAVFWLTTAVLYWVCVFLAWTQTRWRVFLGYEIFTEISARRGLSAIFADIDALGERAWTAIAEAGPVPASLFVVPVVMTLVMLSTPFAVRRDYRRAIRGIIFLPIMAIMSYLFTMLMNMVAAASVELALHFWLGISPGPDLFIFLVHPLYLFLPTAIGSVPGTLSQVVYLLFIVSVLTTPGRRRADDDYEQEHDEVDDVGLAPIDEGSDDEEDARICEMEAERLCRIISVKFGQPHLASDVKRDIKIYIGTPGALRNALGQGMDHYRIVLLEAAKSLRMILDGNPTRPGAADAFEYMVDEMTRLEYCTEHDARTLKSWVASKRAAAER